MCELMKDFEKRKKEHILLSLDETNQASAPFSLQLRHEALPEINFDEVSLEQTIFQNLTLKTPVFISSMTAGHNDSCAINTRLAQSAQKRGWLMGVGSQRRELEDTDSTYSEWKEIRKKAPHVKLMGNIGLSQVINSSFDSIKKLLESLEAQALIIHTNPLQEALQRNGTPFFKGGLKALENTCKKLSVPVILKEVGCGFSAETLARLDNIGLYAVDVSGRGGTHWGRIEQKRWDSDSLSYKVAETFKDWGISTEDSLLACENINSDYKVWASGGIRSGKDIALCLALGSEMVGIAQPMMKAALISETHLEEKMEQIEDELKIALFCTGSQNIKQIQSKKPIYKNYL